MRGPHTAMKSDPHLPQLEKALAQKQRPNIAINQSINQSLKKKQTKKTVRLAGQGVPESVETNSHPILNTDQLSLINAVT